MKTWRIVAAATTTAALATVLCAAVPVAAQEEEPDLLPITVEPTTLTVGTTYTVSGADCLTEEGPGDVQVDVFNEQSDEPDSFPAEVGDDGSWSLELEARPDDVGSVVVTATCFVSPESDEVVADYEFACLEVSATAPTPTVTTPPATTPPVTEPPAPPAAPPATPRVAQPTFTG